MAVSSCLDLQGFSPSLKSALTYKAVLENFLSLTFALGSQVNMALGTPCLGPVGLEVVRSPRLFSKSDFALVPPTFALVYMLTEVVRSP
jgi:hypothetical protein